MKSIPEFLYTQFYPNAKLSEGITSSLSLDNSPGGLEMSLLALSWLESGYVLESTKVV